MGFLFKGETLKNDNLLISNYSIHGLTLCLSTDNEHISSSIEELLFPFMSEEKILLPDITFSLFENKNGNIDLIPFPINLKLLYAPSENDKFDIRRFELNYFKIFMNPVDATYYIDLGQKGRVSYNLEKSEAVGYLTRPESINPKVLSSGVFLFAFDQIMKAKGYFPIHCSAVAKDGKGVLLPGFSGAGKTTTCISLIRSGFGFLGDDRPILHYNDQELELLSFPEDINVTEKTLKFFPELAASELIKINKGLLKKSFCAEDIYPGSVIQRCRPRAVLYPERYQGSKSFVEELSKSEALSSFLPHSMLVFDKDTSKKHFDILFDLINSVDTYRLKLGTNIHELSELVASIL